MLSTSIKRRILSGKVMRDVNRLYDFYNELMKVHIENFPDWRFGQLVSNLEQWLRRNKKINDIYFIEENAMLRYIDEFVEDSKRF